VAKTLWVPAAMSTHAHLVQLIAEGRVRVSDGGPPKRTARYELVDR
jgi:hypothetical protein